jgi:hypothetical protein
MSEWEIDLAESKIFAQFPHCCTYNFKQTRYNAHLHYYWLCEQASLKFAWGDSIALSFCYLYLYCVFLT